MNRSQRQDTGSIHIATVFDIPIRLHITFIIFLAFIALVQFGVGNNAPIGILFTLALFTCVVLHELGHSLTARAYGIKTRSITLYPIGGVAALEEMPRPRQEFWIALAGPLVNVIIALGLFTYLKIANIHFGNIFQLDNNTHIAAKLMGANIMLAGFNMLPAFPMDGGRVLRAVLAQFTSDVQATRIAAIIGRVMAVIFGIYGLVSGSFLMIIIAIFIWIGAGQEASHVQTKALASGKRVRDAMLREFHTIPIGTTLRDVANLLLASSQQDFPVTHNSEVVGLLTRSALIQGMASVGAEAYVSEVMDRQLQTAMPNDDLEPLVQAFTGTVLVFNDGEARDESLVGMVTQENLFEFFMLSQFQPTTQHTQS